MSGIKIVLILLQLTRSILSWLERERAIAEGERREVAKQLAAIAASAQIARETADEISRLTDAQVDDALSGDFRP
jgi:hypothetical protein